MIDRCLSVNNPYAWAIVAGCKVVENRSWSTTYRGRIAIHAGLSRRIVNDKKLVDSFLKADQRIMDAVEGDKYGDTDLLWYGYIIGTAEVIGVEDLEPEDAFDQLDLKYPHNPLFPGLPASTFAEGPFAWILANPERFAHPVPTKGRLNLFKLTALEKRLVAESRQHLLQDPGAPPHEEFDGLHIPVTQ